MLIVVFISSLILSRLRVEALSLHKDNEEIVKNVVESDAVGIYLEDVLYTLKYQNWTDEEIPCLNQTLRMLRSLQNFTLWAVWEWDSITSEPQGLLYGNRYQLGNFDECLNPPWSHTHPDLSTQYCLTDIVLRRTNNVRKRRGNTPFESFDSALDFIQHRNNYSRPLNELTWGACVPVACRASSVERLMATLLARSHLGAVGLRPRIHVNHCQKVYGPETYDNIFYAFIGVATALVITGLTCTYLNNKRSESDSRTLKREIINAFCMKSNARDLLKMNKGDIEVMYGVRFLTMVLIVIDHQIGMFNSGPISNGAQVDKVTLSTAGMLLLHDDLFVDSFFLLSGFLFATSILKLKRLTNPLLLILKRYVRLATAFAMVVFFVCAVFPYTGSGPLWPSAIAAETDPCLRNWWINLLMFNNYYRSEDICIVASWYIPCDFHFFTLTVFLYWLYKQCPRLGMCCAAIVSLASVLIPGIINYTYQLPAVQLFTYDFVTNPRASNQFHLTYIKSHTRFAAYVVGFFSGYIYIEYKSTRNIKKLKPEWSILGSLIGLTIMLAVMTTGVTFLWRSYNPIGSAVYAALNRPAWALGLAMLVLSCAFGHVPLVKQFLSWYPWAPLSRLAYGIYLTHSAVITRNVFVSRGPQINDYPTLLTAAAGVLLWCSLIALIIFLFVEAPANNLVTLCFNYRTKEKQKETKTDDTQASVEPSVSVTPHYSGYLQDNLPSTVNISSKF